MPISHHQRFPAINIDISQGGEGISDTSAATKYLNHFARQQLNFSNQEAFKVNQEEQLAKGHKLYRFKHFYQDIQVEFNDLILLVDQDGNADHIWGYAQPIEDIDRAVNLTEEMAIKQALKTPHPNIKLGSIEVLKNYGLVIWLKDHKSGHLAYKSDLQFEYGNGMAMLQIYADANTGSLLETLPLIHRTLRRAIFETPNNCTPFSLGFLDFQICENASETYSQSRQYLRRCEGQPSTSIPDVDNLYSSFGKIYRYLETQHGYDSFDRRGHPILAQIYGQRCDVNAGYGSARFVFHPNYTNDLTIVGHELMHGVIDYGSRLVYRREPGALNESLADIFGVTAKFWLENDGFDGQSSDADYAVSNVRDMANPIRGDQPDFYPEARNLNDPVCSGDGNDWCGVHINSGIINLAFYLLAEGGQHPQQKTSVQVPGIGIEKAVNIFFEGQKVFSPRTDFREARRRLAARAQALYDSEARHSLNLAFKAVGIPAPAPPQIPISEEETLDNVPSADEGVTPDNLPSTNEEATPDNVPSSAEGQTSDNVPSSDVDASRNNQFLLILLVLLLLLLFFAISRKSKTGTSEKKDLTRDSSQFAEKIWMLSDHKTNQFISLPTSTLMLADGIVIGRSSKFCHEVLPDKHLSSRHARFSIRNNKLFVEDLNTTNGSYINGMKIKPFEPVSLEAGNEIKLAGCRFSVDYK